MTDSYRRNPFHYRSLYNYRLVVFASCSTDHSHPDATTALTISWVRNPAQEFTGKGVAYATVSSALQIPTLAGADIVCALIAPNHRDSLRLARRLGFDFVGTVGLRQQVDHRYELRRDD
jgi:hypothetical protein